MAHNQGGEESQLPIISNLQIEAMINEMRWMMRTEMEHIHERKDRLEGAQRAPPRNIPHMRHRERVPQWKVRADEEWFGEEVDDDDRDSIVNDRRHGGRFRNARNREDNNLGSIKMKIPSFQVDDKHEE